VKVIPARQLTRRAAVNAAGSIDAALGGGCARAEVVKGKAIREVPARAAVLCAIKEPALKDGPIGTVADPSGRTVSVSAAGSRIGWQTKLCSRPGGWGDRSLERTRRGGSAAPAALASWSVDTRAPARQQDPSRAVSESYLPQ
jgi:hypothetical protein